MTDILQASGDPRKTKDVATSANRPPPSRLLHGSGGSRIACPSGPRAVAAAAPLWRPHSPSKSSGALIAGARVCERQAPVARLLLGLILAQSERVALSPVRRARQPPTGLSSVRVCTSVVTLRVTRAVTERAGAHRVEKRDPMPSHNRKTVAAALSPLPMSGASITEIELASVAAALGSGCLYRHGFLGQPGECIHAAVVSANARRTTAGARKPSRSINHCWL